MDDSRFFAMVCPTGFGKSLMYMAAAILSGQRCLVLTSTNALIQQIITDFGPLIAVVKGKANYRCKRLGGGVTCDRGPCNHGVTCLMKDGGCYYYDDIRQARKATIVVTNYAFWIYNNKAKPDEGSVIGEFGLLVCDEAHDCPDRVADAFSVRFSRRNQTERFLLQNFGWTTDIDDTREWAVEARREAGVMYRDAKKGERTERIYQAANAKRKLKDVLRFLSDRDNAVVVPEKKWGVLRVALTWPYDRAESVLFAGIPKVVFTSATVRPKTVEMVGVDSESECTFHEYPHIIDQDRRKLYHIPTIRLNYRTKPIELRTWITRMDQIIKSRIGLSGLIHTVSYARRNEVLKRSKYGDFMMSHGSKDTIEAIEKFKLNQGSILVSPSVTTGYDFPHDTARWQIIGKIAYPDTSDPVVKARCDRDSDYGPYIAAQTLVQTVGRIVRAADDWGESFIIDDNIKWFIWKYAHFTPDWFMGSYESVGSVPHLKRRRK